ncbi:ORF MSV106 putative vaccinia A22R homolog, similar to SW:P20997 [Melanoplus sanguinipes entomopoxvirus]|uniref:ORF MSV106 putative vaccinia A22R homolog, similar to SW:P20997 n=1 Tax=Melanoplus sanguinipes entomopoxvirus TaxID=83191 RepID=Q9YVY6_MSEPV|nr:ORF MSV106 putative vaccinia A22R homolog, similar to SW:P20997 [Melanoplus sanguinipes entomopoxvirus]AAC97652.1 ORF MSV106 putative vaccinia A22R homolog, similar to SW:P20997 [Melanoplus sanguinipes entomopoxvirus 'O']
MNILGIDVGIKNLGLCIINIKDNKYNIICIKTDISKLNYSILDNLYNIYKLDKMDIVLIEHQFKGRLNIQYYGFLLCFFQSKQKKIISIKPPTYNAGINNNSYYNRKKYSVNILKSIIEKCDNVKYINKYKKIDDIADALCLIIKYLKININENQYIQSIQIL